MTELEFSIQRLRERRTLVMGIAALMIYFAHVYSYADLGTLGAFFTYANWGVDVFLLVSGFGIGHSIAKCPIARKFYWKRLVRVGVPYLILAVPFYFASDILVADQGDWGLFVLDVSTLSYWLLHRGAWYVSMLVPLYLLVPLVGSFCRRFGAPIVCIVATVLSAAVALFLKAAFTDAGLALNVANVFQRIPSFFTGYLLADRLISGKSRGGVSVKAAVLGSVLALLGWFLSRNTGCTSFMPALVIAFWVSAPQRLPFECFLEKLDKASLESYLLNIYVLALMRDAFGWAGIADYLIVTVISMVVALLLHHALERPLEHLVAMNPVRRTAV